MKTKQAIDKLIDAIENAMCDTFAPKHEQVCFTTSSCWGGTRDVTYGDLILISRFLEMVDNDDKIKRFIDENRAMTQSFLTNIKSH